MTSTLLHDSPQLSSPSTRRRWLALAVLMFPVLLISVDNTALSFAVPSLSRSLAPSGNQLLWIIDIYPLMLAALLVPMGTLGDRWGRRRILLLGSLGFALVSALAAFAPNAAWLIAARGLLGVFGAMLMPATLSLIRNIFTDATERRTAIAVWACGFSAGAALGPVVGGWLLQHFWWGSIFLLAVPLLVPILVLGPALLPESKDPDPGPVDPIGIAQVVVALGSLVLAIKTLASLDGRTPIVPVLILALGVLSGTAFVRRMLRRPNPMLEVRLFRNPVFSGALLVNLISVFSLVGFIYFFAQHLQLVAGRSPMESGELMLPALAASVVFGLAAVPLAARLGTVRVVVVGLMLSSTGYLVVAVLGQSSAIAVLVGASVLLGTGVGMAETLSNDLALSAVPPEKAGAASAVSETAYEVGAVLGTAVLGSLLNLAYRTGLQMPAGVSGELAERANATLGGAAEVVETLPAPLAKQLWHSATAAFDSGVVLIGVVGCVLSLAVAVLASRMLADPTTQR